MRPTTRASPIADVGAYRDPTSAAMSPGTMLTPSGVVMDVVTGDQAEACERYVPSLEGPKRLPDDLGEWRDRRLRDTRWSRAERAGVRSGVRGPPDRACSRLCTRGRRRDGRHTPRGDRPAV